VPGGSDWAGTIPVVYEKLRTIDFGFVPGRGVFGHPMGPAAGATSLRQAWEAIVRKIPLSEYAKDHQELKEAIQVFGQGKVPYETSSHMSDPYGDASGSSPRKGTVKDLAGV
jgi:ribulose-bisphosphate carboxylase large chain